MDHNINVLLGGGKQRFEQIADGANMTVNYGTNLHGRSQEHTGSQVRIAAQGPQAANVVGVTDQTDLFHAMARALGLD